MKTIEIKLDVQKELSMTDATRAAIEKSYPRIGQTELQKLWKPAPIPAKNKLAIDVSGACICVMDDWECLIFGKSYLNCLAALCIFHTHLTNDLRKKVTLRMLSLEHGESSFDELLASEHRRRCLIKIGWFVTAAIVGALIGELVRYIICIL